MKLTRLKLPALGAAAVLAAASLACNLPSPKVGGPEPPPDAPTASDEALKSFNDKWEDLSQTTPNGPFSVTFTEAELTSAVVEGMRQHEADSGEPVPVQNPQMILRDGVISIYMTLQADIARVNGLVVMQPVIAQNGLVALMVTQAEFGPVDVDPSQLDALVVEAERTINAPIQASPADVTLSEIVIADGQMTVNGTIFP